VEEPCLPADQFTWVSDVRQTEIRTAEPLVPELSAFEVEMSMVKVKRPKSPGTDQIPAEMFEAGRGTTHCEIHKLINSIRNKEEWNKLFIVPIYKKGNETDCSNYRGISLL